VNLGREGALESFGNLIFHCSIEVDRIVS
jgi:hypothetical protein